MYSGLAWTGNRVDGSISIDWKPALLLVPEADKTYQVKVNTVVAECKIDVDQIKNDVAKRTGTRGDRVQWSL